MTNFKFDIDADGIALITWDMPDRSMNVIDHRGDRRARGASSTRSRATPRSRARSSPPARTPSAAAPTSRCCKRLTRDVCTAWLQGQGEEAAAKHAVRGKPQAVAALSQARNLRQAVGRRDQRHRAGRLLRARARLPSPHRRRQSEDPARPAGDQGRAVPRRRRHDSASRA